MNWGRGEKVRAEDLREEEEEKEVGGRRPSSYSSQPPLVNKLFFLLNKNIKDVQLAFFTSTMRLKDKEKKVAKDSNVERG